MRDVIQALAEHLGSAVATTYLHNDSFPCDHPLACGPLGYQGHKAAMHAVHEVWLVVGGYGLFGMNQSITVKY